MAQLAMLELHHSTRGPPSVGLLPSTHPTCHPTSNAASTVPSPDAGAGIQSIWGRALLCPHLGREKKSGEELLRPRA